MAVKWNAWVEGVTPDGVWMAGESESGDRWEGLWPLSDVPEDCREPGTFCHMRGVRIVEWCREVWTAEEIAEAERAGEEMFRFFSNTQ